MKTVLGCLFLGWSLVTFAAGDGVSARARDLGIWFDGVAGPRNAITDVAGVAVNQLTRIELPDGDPHAVRTGITVIYPKASAANSHVPGAFSVLNGNGESTGTNWIDESGDLEGPILLTNTYSVGVVRDAVRAWANVKFPTTSADYDDAISLPVVSETWDGWVNDINGQHITAQNVFDLLDQKPDTGTVAEGDVGGGTGDACFEFKCGIGTSSRVVTINNQKYTLGVLVQANFGKRQDLMIAGVPVGKFLTDNLPIQAAPTAVTGKDGSIVVVVATDAPLLPEQLARVARRVPLGLGRTGMISDNSSGDLFFAFSTSAPSGGNLQQWSALSNDVIVDLFRAVPPAVEEAIVNSLVAGRTLGGVNGNKVYGIDTDRLVRVMKSWSPIHPVLP